MTCNHTRGRTTRSGFTLVELMVAMALSLGIMVILTEAFKMSLEFTSHSGSTGRLIAQLDAAEMVLRRDLHADHFLVSADTPGQTGKLIDQRLDKLTNTLTGWVPPPGGFFQIRSTPPYFEVNDRDSLAITTATDHALHFTAIYPGGSEDGFFTATVPPGSNNVYRSRAAEVAYFLVPMQGSPRTSQDGNGRPLYNLIRRQRLVALTADDRAALSPALSLSGAADVISAAGGQINTLHDVQVPARRMFFTPGSNGELGNGDDIVVSNVLSFQVLVDWDRNSNPSVAAFLRGVQNPRPFVINTDFPYDHLWQGGGSSGSPSLFDTYAPTLDLISQAIRVKSLQISLRIFDPSTKMARQNTWVFTP
jgi:prepilin-type N-terminal cleavage/methylation domain-containing protein